jgi:serine/threonine protein phosphatase 1
MNLFSRRPTLPRGLRIYAVGDVHGRFDLLARLLDLIREDAALTPARSTKLVFLGDVVDRGPDSASVVQTLMTATQSNNLIVLRGNHEQTMLAALCGDREAMDMWLRFGGDATLRSWGVTDKDLKGDRDALIDIGRAKVGEDVIGWLRSLPLCHRAGDFFFVHAGVRPECKLSTQEPLDLMWIREEFLESTEMHEAVIVHGHSISELGPEILRHRIGIDTGAYRTGRLAAVGFEGARQWVLVSEVPLSKTLRLARG